MQNRFLHRPWFNKSDIIDLTAKVSTDGMLEWNAPEGEWIILRIGHTPTGKRIISAPVGGQGIGV